MRLLDRVLLIATIVCALLLLCAYLARYVNPATAWFFAFAGLVAPVLMVSNILLALYWVVRWRWYVFIPAVALLLGVNYFGLFFRPSLSKGYPVDNKGSVKVMTYNVMGFLQDGSDGKAVWQPDSTLAFVRLYNPDILCIQEFQCMTPEQKTRVDSLIGLPYNCVNYRLKTSAGRGWGLAIYSRWPIIAHDKHDFSQSTNSSLWADVAIGKDTVRVFCNHLQTTSVGHKERKYIDNQQFLHNSPDRETVVRGILSKLKRNFVIRAAQVDTLAPTIAASPYDVIVCGDFNDTPMSYTYFRMRDGLRDAFIERGQGMGSNTYKGLFNMFRIDYIFHSPSIKALHYSTPSSEYSDHKAVLTEFIIL